MTATILIAGGGTGGHVFPALAVASALASVPDAPRVEFVGTARGLEARLVPDAGWPLHTVDAVPMARRLSPSAARLPWAVWRAARAATALLRDRNVVAAAVFGGYVSVPLILAAWRTGTPLVVHEQNAVPGVANRLAALRAVAVAASFPSSAARFGRRVAVHTTGNPVRPGLDAVDRDALRAEAYRMFGLDPARRTLLVFGGSQGARRLNQAAVGSAPHWARPDALQILHAAGRGGYAQARQAWAEAPAGDAAADAAAGPLVRCVDFVERMDLAYAAADLVLCRAGASSIAELTVLGLPAVLVPYPHATADHQTANARDVAATGAAVVVADADLDGARLVAEVEPLLLDDVRRERMAAAARDFARPEAAASVAALILQAARPAVATSGRAG